MPALRDGRHPGVHRLRLKHEQLTAIGAVMCRVDVELGGSALDDRDGPRRMRMRAIGVADEPCVQPLDPVEAGRAEVRRVFVLRLYQRPSPLSSSRFRLPTPSTWRGGSPESSSSRSAAANAGEPFVFERSITDEFVKMALKRMQRLVSDLRGPPFAHVVEQGSTDGGHLVPAGSHPKALAALVLRVGLSLDVAELLEGDDRLRGRLLGNRQAASELGGRVRSPVDGSQSELVAGRTPG